MARKLKEYTLAKSELEVPPFGLDLFEDSIPDDPEALIKFLSLLLLDESVYNFVDLMLEPGEHFNWINYIFVFGSVTIIIIFIITVLPSSLTTTNKSFINNDPKPDTVNAGYTRSITCSN
jgi:hypothetical protein